MMELLLIALALCPLLFFVINPNFFNWRRFTPPRGMKWKSIEPGWQKICVFAVDLPKQHTTYSVICRFPEGTWRIRRSFSRLELGVRCKKNSYEIGVVVQESDGTFSPVPLRFHRALWVPHDDIPDDLPIV